MSNPEIAKRIQEFIDAGIDGLTSTDAAARGWPKWRAHLRHASVILRERPAISLAVPRTELANVIVHVKVTGELWFYGPKPTWDFPWNWPIKWQLWASASPGLTFGAAAHLDVRTDGHLVRAGGVFDDLRLTVPILDLINLAGLANGYLAGKSQVVYDTRKLVVSIPVLDERFHVAAVNLPAGKGQITIEVDVAKL